MKNLKQNPYMDTQYKEHFDHKQAFKKYRFERLGWKAVILEWICLKLGKCPACKLGVFPHRNCILR